MFSFVSQNPFDDFNYYCFVFVGTAWRDEQWLVSGGLFAFGTLAQNVIFLKYYCLQGGERSASDKSNDFLNKREMLCV